MRGLLCVLLSAVLEVGKVVCCLVDLVRSTDEGLVGERDEIVGRVGMRSK